MKPLYLRKTTDEKIGLKGTWIKSVFIFGIKVAEWQYYSIEQANKVGYGK